MRFLTLIENYISRFLILDYVRYYHEYKNLPREAKNLSIDRWATTISLIFSALINLGLFLIEFEYPLLVIPISILLSKAFLSKVFNNLIIWNKIELEQTKPNDFGNLSLLYLILSFIIMGLSMSLLFI